MTITQELIDSAREEIVYEDDGKDKVTHIVDPAFQTNPIYEGMAAKEIVHFAYTNSLEVIALCGYTWVPKSNPDKYDACEPCMKIAQFIMQKLGQ